jgi:hypothetical protein
VGEEAHRHLGTAGVVSAQKQHGGLAVVVQTFHLGQRAQPLAGETFGHQRQEVRDGGGGGELVERGVQEPLDGLRPEDPGEVVGQLTDGDLQGHGLLRLRVSQVGVVSVSLSLIGVLLSGCVPAGSDGRREGLGELVHAKADLLVRCLERLVRVGGERGPAPPNAGVRISAR